MTRTLLRDRAFINGEWQKGGGKPFAVTNPASGNELAEIHSCTADDTHRAIEAAQAAFPYWAAKTAQERAKILRRWYELLMEHQQDLAHVLTQEQGKPLKEATGEIAYGASFIEWFAEEARRVYGDVIPTYESGKRIFALKQPIGVVAAITPWNFPNAMITRKIAPALAAGCTVVIKPAAETPLSALALCVLAEEAGFPAGVINILPTADAKTVGKELCNNPAVRKLSFTGSTETGKILMAQCAGTVKKLSLELGGNAPFIVFDDADIDAAVEGAMASKFRNAGQTCVCANRILVQDAVFDAFADKLQSAIEKLKVGDGMQSGVEIGPLINEKGMQKVQHLVDDALANGAKCRLGGKPHQAGALYFQPTLLTGVTPDMAIAGQEIFGPVATLFRFESEEDAIRLANDTPYGLASYFYARDAARIWRVGEALEYGIVGANTGMISSEVAPFGGVKESGFGREGSRYGIEEYVEIKYFCHGGLGK